MIDAAESGGRSFLTIPFSLQDSRPLIVLQKVSMRRRDGVERPAFEGRKRGALCRTRKKVTRRAPRKETE